MKNFQQKSKFARILESKIFLFVLFVIIVFISFSVITLVIKAKETFKNKNIAEQKMTELQSQKEKLVKDIKQLNTENGIEENIRDKFGLAKDGEGVVVIMDDKNTENDINVKKPNRFISFLKNWFK